MHCRFFVTIDFVVKMPGWPTVGAALAHGRAFLANPGEIRAHENESGFMSAEPGAANT